jgi:hypothetical protein
MYTRDEFDEVLERVILGPFAVEELQDDGHVPIKLDAQRPVERRDRPADGLDPGLCQSQVDRHCVVDAVRVTREGDQFHEMPLTRRVDDEGLGHVPRSPGSIATALIP